MSDENISLNLSDDEDKLDYLYLKYSNNDIEKLNNSIKELEKNFPNIFYGIKNNDEKLNYLLKECFWEGYNNTYYFTNASHTYTNKKGEKKELRKLYLRPQKGRFLEDNISDDLTLSFRGYVSVGFFVINEIVIIGNYDGCKKIETEIDVTPYHTNIPPRYRGEYLNELINYTMDKSIAKHLNKNLENWSNYLDWRKELVKIRLAGIKYFNFYFDEDKQYIIFHLVARSKNDFDKIRKYFRRENIKVFDNEYSSNEWIFKFNEKSRKNRDAIPLGRYVGIIKEMNYNISQEDIAELNKVKEKNKEKGINGFDFNIIDEDIKENIESISDNPYLIEMAFEIEESILDELKDKVKDDVLDKKLVKAYVEEKIFNKLKKDGFLALSAVGDFVLLRRLQSAIARLRRDESYCPNLPLWLFNIKSAEIPNIKNVKIDTWLNKDIENNREQKMAVIKMLAAKDVCLIQGPPGTGKTTVIAEAIYQFVSRGERVLIASQTNLAVDNALERLAKEPIIRAIRLNAQKSTEDIEHMTEDKALNYFFKNIADKLDSNYLNKWENNERIINNLDKYLRDINQYIERIKQYTNKLNSLREEKEKLHNDIDAFNEEIHRIKNKNSNLNRIKNQINLFNEFIKENNDIEIILPKDYINLILDNINDKMHSLENIKIDILNLNTDNMQEEILTKGIKEIYKNINYFYNMKKDVESSSNIEKSHEVLLLDSEIKVIEDKIRDKNTSEEEAIKLIPKLKKLQKEKSNHKTSSFELKETYKDLLDDSIINEYKNSNNTSVIKECINKNISKIDEIKKFFDNIEECSNTYKDSLKVEDTKELENQLKTSEGRIRIIDEEEANLTKSLNEDNKKINDIKKENDISDEKPNDEIYNILLSKKEEISKSIEEDKDIRDNFENIIKRFKDKLENADIKYENSFFKDKYINSCNVVGISCTENTRILEDKGFNYFDVVIIDEVSKATPAELLIPMLKSKKVILVGDHRQLPPLFGEYEKSYKEIIDTIEDTEENKEIRNILTEENFNKFEKMVTSSIFKEYFEKAPEEIKHSLLTQFRMHTDIMNIINRFYEGKLESGIKDKENIIKDHKLEIKRTDNLPFISRNKHAYWIDSSSIKTSDNKYENIYESTYKNSTSYSNILEINIIIELLKKIANAYKKLNLEERPTIGVISLYQLQVNKLRNILKEERRKGTDFSSIYIDINTVDKFQGKEKEIVIVSLVRNPQTGKSKSKHITAFERVNVAFSRAQKALIIVGAKTLYEKLDVELPNMDREGKENKKVYKGIIADLIYKDCLFYSDCVISYKKAENILKEYNNNKMDN
ncbi:AAA domain-containing protein [Brachyspira sp. SAP_772]|uniref:AAA domain-containing protein n=1 Tax=Brachyspira sp. SAP_772 TaxID=2608385 RepID=UPI0012F4DD67|nr:AAA domain-containing protein [Brachyspira sp. SAP_772]